MTDQHLVDAISTTNPYPDVVATMDARDAAFEVVSRRIAARPAQRERRSVHGWKLAFAVLAGVLAVAAAILVVTGGRSQPVAPSDPVLTTSTTAPPPSTSTTSSTVPEPTTTTVVLSPEETAALGFVGAFFDEWAIGTLDGYLDRFDPDAAVAICPNVVCTRPFRITVDDYAIATAHSFGVSARQTSRDCEVVLPSAAPVGIGSAFEDGLLPTNVLVVECVSELLSYTAAMSSEVPEKSQLHLAISGDRIVAFDAVTTLGPSRAELGFLAWMQSNHPDEDADIECCRPEEWSLQEHFEAGQRWREFVDLWVVALEAAGCEWDDPACDP